MLYCEEEKEIMPTNEEEKTAIIDEQLRVRSRMSSPLGPTLVETRDHEASLPNGTENK
jgi:hypothetical protein